MQKYKCGKISELYISLSIDAGILSAMASLCVCLLCGLEN